MPFKRIVKRKEKSDQGKAGRNENNGGRLKTVQRVLVRNIKIFNQYNQFRKKLFFELASADNDTIFHLLPWLISVNHPECPGYVPNLKRSFRVFGVDRVKEIKDLEDSFKKQFGVSQQGSLIKYEKEAYLIQGLYTIGSVGSISQTSGSDCDIWVCVDGDKFGKSAWRQLNEKMNLIKDWMDLNSKMPVYFFISDINAIRECRFGSVDEESSGSTQQNVLKEEFYRSCMVICGKIPLWWLCHYKGVQVAYEDALKVMDDENFWEYDVIDFGDVERIDQSEYFGAALWHFHKSLLHPLKSIVKMNLLKILLDAKEDRLMCHRFREKVFSSTDSDSFPDFSIFTMDAIVEDFRKNRPDLLNFLVESFYIMCEYDPDNRNQKMKNRLAGAFFKQFDLSRERRIVLGNSDKWEIDQQIKLGDDLFKQLFNLYKEISAEHAGIASESDKHDLTILGRKISAFYMKKRYKVPVLQKHTGMLNISNPIMVFKDRQWFVRSDLGAKVNLCSNKDFIYNIAFIVWNSLFNSGLIRMKPNPSDITLQEAINLGRKIEQFFETYETMDNDYSNYLREENLQKMLIVVGLEKNPWFKEVLDLRVLYLNCWGELFARHFRTLKDFENFVLKARKDNPKIETRYYIRRNNTSYEKIIERTKKVLRTSIEP
jgi:adenylate cyclase class 1